MTHRTPAQLRSDDAVALADILTRSGTCQGEVAALTGVSRTVVQRWYDRLERHLPHVHDLRRLPTSLARRILEWCAEPHGLAVVERVESADAATHMEHLSRGVKEGSEAIMAYTEVIAKGATPASLERAISEIREDIAQKSTMLELMKQERDAMRPRAVRGGAA